MPSAGISGFRVEGLNKLVRDLLALGLEVDDLKDAFASIASKGANLAASYAPRRTGQLADSIRGNRAKSKAVITAGRVGTPYAGAINYGWPRRGIRAAEFMQRADEQLRPYALAELQSAVDAKIREKGLQ